MNEVVMIMKENSSIETIKELKKEIIENNLLISIIKNDVFDALFKNKKDEEDHKGMLVKYVRNNKNSKIGVVVATGRDRVGWSMCHRLDKFDKAKALKIAKGRAERGSNVSLPGVIFNDYNAMTDRSERFYQ